MVAICRATCSISVLLVWFACFAPRVEVEAQGLHEGVERVAQQGGAWHGSGRDTDGDRWSEESERLNRLKFDREGNWRVPEERDGSADEVMGEEPSGIQRLRVEGEKRERAVRLAWERRAKKIRNMWGSVRESGPTVYMEYTKDNDAFGGVDYKEGFLEVGAVAPIFFSDAPVRVERLLSERLSFLFVRLDADGLSSRHRQQPVKLLPQPGARAKSTGAGDQNFQGLSSPFLLKQLSLPL